jgi:hypothetical protein
MKQAWQPLQNVGRVPWPEGEQLHLHMVAYGVEPFIVTIFLRLTLGLLWCGPLLTGDSTLRDWPR